MTEQIVFNKSVELAAAGMVAEGIQLKLTTDGGEAMYVGAFLLVRPGDILGIWHVFFTNGHYTVGGPDRDTAIAAAVAYANKYFNEFYKEF